MRPLILAAALLSSFLGAQEAVTLDHSLQLDSTQLTVGQGGWSASSAYTQASYQFNVGAPIVEYRLGSVNLGGALTYLQERAGDRKDSDLGVHTLALGGSLFPYQPYHLTFDVSRSTTPSLFESRPQTSSMYGLGFSYRGSTIQGLRLDYRHGESHGDFGSQGWSLFRMAGVQRTASTDIHYFGDHATLGSGGAGSLQRTSLGVFGRTYLSRDWTWLNQVSAQGSAGTRSIQVGSDLSGYLGAWTSLSSASASYQDSEIGSARTLVAAQSLAYTKDQASCFGQVSLSGGAARGRMQGSSIAGSMAFGGTYRLSPAWSVMADAGASWSGNGTEGQGTASRTTAVHAGVAWGGGLSDQLKHLLFFWSDLRFQRQIQEDYPPGFIPADLADEILRRRALRDGSFQFTGDVYHMATGQGGRQDWLRASGGMTLGNGVAVQTQVDWRKEQAFYRPGTGSLDRDCFVNGAFMVAKTRFNVGVGYFHSEVLLGSGSTLTGNLGGGRTFTTLAVDRRILGLMWGALAARSRDARGGTTTTVTTHLAGSFRSMGFNITVSEGRQSNGIHNRQITVNLRRWFDTMTLWGTED